MKILYDHQAFAFQKFGGVSRYFAELIKGVDQASGFNAELAVKYSNNVYLKELNFTRYSGFISRDFKAKSILMDLLNRPESVKRLLGSGYDVFHPTYYNPYFLKYLAGKKFVLTVHDMTHELFPEKINRWDKSAVYKKVLVQSAARIIAVSSNTKKDLINLLKVPSEKIEVIHHASSIDVQSALPFSALNVPDNYMLFVGTRGYYKNFITFLIAAARLLKEEKKLFLVCAGGGNFNKHERRLINNLGIPGRIFYKSVDDKILAALYKNARVFILPSLYEGFGIPVLEAFNCGCPVILSNTSSLPEIAEDAALYFDPLNKEEIYTLLRKVITEDETRENLIIKGSVQNEKFSWPAAIVKTLKVYSSL